ncbi:MAG: hypothetical protein ACYC0J_10335 [Gammaproteobacteria bacterium]
MIDYFSTTPGGIVPNPSVNVISFQSPPLVFNGAPSQSMGGLNINISTGGNVDNASNAAYNFLKDVTANNQGFVKNTIAQENNFFQPLANNATDLFAKSLTTSQDMFSQALTIQQSAINHSSSGGGGSYVCTASHELSIIDDGDYELLIKFKNGFMRSSAKTRRLLCIYSSKAPQIVDSLMASPLRKELFKRLHEKYLSVVIDKIRSNDNETALVTYQNMMCEAQRMAVIA